VHPFCAIGRPFGYDGGMDANEKRPWYRLHWGTVLVVFFVGLDWLNTALPRTFGGLLGNNDVWMYLDEGWPFIGVRRNLDTITVVRPVALAIDGALALVCLLSTAFVVERLERSNLRFGLSSLIAAVTSLAVLLAFWQWNGQQANVVLPWPQNANIEGYVRLDGGEFQGLVPILFALGCTIYTVGWLMLRFASWPLSRLRRPGSTESP